jgi:hypothetical protein
MTRNYYVAETEIEALSYLKCPRKAAQYLGIDERRVKRIWGKMGERAPLRKANFDTKRQGYGNDADERWAERCSYDSMTYTGAIVQFIQRNGAMA